MLDFLEDTAQQIHDPPSYIKAVLSRSGRTAAMIGRILPHPLLTLLLIVVWQMLVNQVTAGSLLLGLVFGIVIPLVTSPYWPDRPKLRRPLKFVPYALIVAVGHLRCQSGCGACHSVQAQRGASQHLGHRASRSRAHQRRSPFWRAPSP